MKAVIFDLDGTLLDVREGFYWQFQELTKLYDGAPVSREMIDASAHGTTEQIVRTLVKNTSVNEQEILQAHRELRLRAYDHSLKLYDGVADVLAELVSRGIHVGALTSGNQLTVDCLSRMRIHHYFSEIIGAHHIENPKPHPEGLLLLMERLNVEPGNTIMVGDMVADILVGKNAGVKKTVGVLHGFGNEADLHEAGADHLTHDLSTIMQFAV